MTDAPPELDPFWPSRIEEDRLWYGHYAEAGEFFYSPCDNHVFRVSNPRQGGDAFDLQPCAVAVDLQDGFSAPSGLSNHHVNNVCSLAGAVELGDLIHLEDGTLRTVRDDTFLSVGDLAVKIEDTKADSDALLEQFDPPRGPDSLDIAKLATPLSEMGANPTLYAPQSVVPEKTSTDSQGPSRATQAAAQDVETQFIPVSPFSKWTFEDDTIRGWVEDSFQHGETVLNACAGETKLTPPPGGEILRNDINTDREADFHVDVVELASLDALGQNSVDRVVFDPPWSVYQSNLRYQSEHVHQVSKEGVHDIDLSALPFETPGPGEKTQVGHAALAKRGFDYLLKPGGEVLELTFHGTSMPSSLGYQRQERVIFDPVGEARAVIGSVDRKVRRELTEFP
jgi:hypothetical protein